MYLPYQDVHLVVKYFSYQNRALQLFHRLVLSIRKTSSFHGPSRIGKRSVNCKRTRYRISRIVFLPQIASR